MRGREQDIISRLLGLVVFRVLSIHKRIPVGFSRLQIYSKQLATVLAAIATIKQFTKIRIWLRGATVMSSHLYICNSYLLNNNPTKRLYLKGRYDSSIKVTINVTKWRWR